VAAWGSHALWPLTGVVIAALPRSEAIWLTIHALAAALTALFLLQGVQLFCDRRVAPPWVAAAAVLVSLASGWGAVTTWAQASLSALIASFYGWSAWLLYRRQRVVSVAGLSLTGGAVALWGCSVVIHPWWSPPPPWGYLLVEVLALWAGFGLILVAIETERWNSVEVDGQQIIQSIVRDLSEAHRQEAELKQQARDLSILLETARIAASSLEPSALAQAVLDEVVRSFDAEVGAVFVDDSEAGVLRMLSHHGHSPDFVQAFQTIPLDHPGSLPARVARTGIPLLVKDPLQQSGITLPEHRDIVPHAMLIAPLTAREHTVGILTVGCLPNRQFTAKDLSLLAAVGQQVGVAIENARLFAQIQEQVRELAFLVGLGAGLNATQELEETARVVLGTACSLIGAERGALFTFDSSRQTLQLLAHHNLPPEIVSRIQSQPLLLTTGVFEDILGHPDLVEVPDIALEPRYQYAPGQVWHQVCYLPLRIEDRLVGVIELGALPGSDVTRRLLRTVGDLAAVAIERARLTQAARKRADRCQAIGRLTQEMNAERNLDRLLQSLVEAAGKLLEADQVALFLSGGPDEAWTCAAVTGGPPPASDGFLGEIIRHVRCKGELVMAARVADIPGFVAQKMYPEADERALMYVPLVHRTQMLGALLVTRLSTRPFESDDVELLSMFANHAAITIQNARLNQETEWRAHQLQSVAQISAQISSTLDWDQLVAQIAEHASELAQVPRTILLLHDSQSDEMVVAAVRGYDFGVPLSDMRFKRGQELIGIAWETGRPLMTQRAGDDPRYAQRANLKEVADWSILILPLTAGGRIIGMLGFGDEAGRSFSATEQETLTLLANQAAIALSNARLYDALQRYSEQLEAQVAARTADLQVALERAQEADRLKSAFLATISHELRTPLASIKGFASTLLQDDIEWDKATQREFLSIIDGESDQLMGMINQLLDVSRLEKDALMVKPVACDLEEIIARIAARLQVLTRSHRLRVNIPPDLPLVYADQQRIGQVFSNLIENAARYAPVGTEIAISAVANGNQIIASVSDQGIGIAPEYHKRIFERFFRIEGDSSRSGTGLGLAICRGIVEAHGGRIWVESVPGQGSEFMFTLPAAQSIENVNQERKNK
jgi:K+-sensing histidine kinase KdpD